MNIIKTLIATKTADAGDIPAILRRDGPAVKTNPDAAVIKAAKVTITTVPQGMTKAKVEKAKAKEEKKAKLPVPTGKTARQMARTKLLQSREEKKPSKKQTLADDAVKSVAKPPVRKLDYDWAANEKLAQSGKLPNLGPWNSYKPHMEKARDFCAKGDFKAAQEIMGGHRNVAKNRDGFYNLLKEYIKAKS
jgi:hypothetical protein